MTSARGANRRKGEFKVTRSSLPSVIKAFRRGDEKSARRWNIVEVLELLVDAGHFSFASALCERVIEMVEGDGRARLFHGYAALCSLMSKGNQSESLEALERYYVAIHNAGHSVADKVRISMLLARAIAVCVGVGSLAQGALLRARNVLGIELERLTDSAEHELYAQVVLELAKMYLHAPTPDPRAAYALIENAAPRLRQVALSEDRGFDLTRVTYQAAKLLNLPTPELISEESLRARAKEIGGIAGALAELAIARRSAEVDTERLALAADTLEEAEFLSGAYEAVFLLATHALDRTHNAVGERHCRRALELAQLGGFIHGELLALIGLFQSASLADSQAELKARCNAIVSRLDSEFALGSSGLNAAAVQQISGDVGGALRTAKRCEAFFRREGISAFQAQAFAIIGTCEAQSGKWKKAETAWRGALELDKRRHAFTQAAERAALVVQALVMQDITTHSQVKAATRRKCELLLNEADKAIRDLGDSQYALDVRARLQSVSAQLCVMSREHVSALRAFSVARAMYESLGMQFEVALTDAFIGLSMIEVGKTTTPELLEEAVLTLQRAHQFFSSPPYPLLRWKLLYYMAVAGLFISNNSASPVERLKWRELSVSWTRSCERDIEAAADAPQPPGHIGFETEFAPGLNREVLQELREALGLRERRGRKQDRETSAKQASAAGEFIH
jgi:tetratricopeptide (TPR) repeat protein